jgi:hypothetical protein
MFQLLACRYRTVARKVIAGRSGGSSGTGYCSARLGDERPQPDVPPPDSDLPAPHHPRRIRERVGGADSDTYRPGRPVHPGVRAAGRTAQGVGALFPRGGGPRPDAGSCANPNPDLDRDRHARSAGDNSHPSGLAAAPARPGAGASPLPPAPPGEHASARPDGRRPRGGGGRRHARPQRDRVLRTSAGCAHGGAGDRPLPA